jgi:hypothetical protein
MSRRQEAAALLCRYETRALAVSAFAMWLVAPTPCAWSRTVLFLGVAPGKLKNWIDRPREVLPRKLLSGV